MKTVQKSTVIIILLTFLTLVGCASQGETALTVTGNIANEESWTEKQVNDMDAIDVEYTNKDGEVSMYTGVLISDLLNLARPNSDASAVVFLADDGYSAETTLEEVMSCTNCIVSFQDQGGFRIVMPDFSSKLQVKGVIEIQVK
jgi:uncharacterized lipoprotein NlpE involved in copper resistance